MAWLARSFTSHFQEEPDEEEQGEKSGTEKDQGRGMKEDLSELTRSFTKQLWGVASFLAPPPATTDAAAAKPVDSSAALGSSLGPSASDGYVEREVVDQTHDAENSVHGDTSDNTQRLMGIRSDIAEISGSVRTGLSRFSSNKAVHEISKLATNLLPFRRDSEGDDDEEGEEEKSGEIEKKSLISAVGITEEVLTFARNISMHPETWLDFPLFNDEDDLDDFDMSEIQREHAFAIEHLAPRLAALRTELCPGYMSEGRFWKIYFVLLHSRLNKQDALMLSTPQIVEARGMLMQELQNRTKDQRGHIVSDISYSEEKNSFLPQLHTFSKQSNNLEKNDKSESFKIVSLQAATSVASKDFQIEDQTAVTSTQRGIFSDQVHNEEPLIQNKTVLSGTVKLSEYKYEEEEVDDWLEEEPAGTDVPVTTRSGLENEEDVSFSDLEDEDDANMQATYSNVNESFHSSSKATKGWVQLDKTTNYVEGSTSHNSSGEGSSPSHSKLMLDLHISHNRETSSERHAKKPGSRESNDWLTVEEDDIISADSS